MAEDAVAPEGYTQRTLRLTSQQVGELVARDYGGLVGDLSPESVRSPQEPVSHGQRLQRSVREEGIKEPVHLQERNGQLQLLDGHHRASLVVGGLAPALPAVLHSCPCSPPPGEPSTWVCPHVQRALDSAHERTRATGWEWTPEPASPTLYHVNPETGEPRRCRATKRACPFGGEESHYPTREAARTAYEAQHSAFPAPRLDLARRYSKDPEVNRRARLIRLVLSDDAWVEDNRLLKEEYRGGSLPLTGHCYAASEALYHLMGGKATGWKAKGLSHEGSSHWFLESPTGEVVDLTAEQFSTSVPYGEAKGRGFLTKDPSRRARLIMERVGEPWTGESHG